MAGKQRMTAHPDFPRLYNSLANCSLFAAWQGDVVRQALPRYMSRPYRLTGLGPVKAGGRYTVPGLMPTVYASTDAATLAAELNYKAPRYGLTPGQLRAQLTIGMRWKLQGAVDLTMAATLGALGVSKAEIVNCDWLAEQNAGREALTQAIARAAFERLAEGLIVPSARRPGGVNIVYFPSHRRDGTVIETYDEASVSFFHGL
jgi:RES domain-containing protein